MQLSLIIIAHIGGILFILSMLSNLYLFYRKVNDPSPLTFLEIYKSIDIFLPKLLDAVTEMDVEKKAKANIELKNTIVTQRLLLQDKIESYIKDKRKIQTENIINNILTDEEDKRF